MKEFIKLSITNEFIKKAENTDFSQLKKSYPNESYNTNNIILWYSETYKKVCNLFYYETGILLSYHGEFYGYYN